METSVQDNTEILSKLESILTKIIFTNYQLSVTVADQNFANSQVIVGYLQQLLAQLTHLHNTSSEAENIKIPMQVLEKIDDNQNPMSLIAPHIRQLVLVNQKSAGRQDLLASICKELEEFYHSEFESKK